MNTHDQTLIKDRLENFRLRTHYDLTPEWTLFDAEFRHCPDAVPFAQRLKGRYRPIKEGEKWGGTWESGWFRLTGTVPRSWKGKQVVALLDFNGEGLVFRPDGTILQGITNGSQFDLNFSRDRVPLFSKCKGGEKVELWVEAAGNVLFGVNSISSANHELHLEYGKEDPRRYGSHSGIVNKMRLCTFDEELWHYRLDLFVLKDLAESLPEDAVRRKRLYRALMESLRIYADNPANAASARSVLKPAFSCPATGSDLSMYAVGHAHIDTGWLWPVRESIRKSARTFSSQLALIERYPGYVFGASQPQHYLFVKEHYPELYEKIRKQVRKGNWELQGGMWVEADCNIISGESMVRQILHGKNFFMDEFGVDVRNLWLPDVFGYSAAMPQILRKSGIDYFVTQKISWSQFNKFPHHTFRWEGIDGSEVITHFPPENTYNSALWPSTLVKGRNHFHEGDFLEGFLCLFGVGDGGGGPKEEHIEHGLRQANLEGAPRVYFSRAQDFLDTLQPLADQLPNWVGELYLELHRGTLTTQSRVKKDNRRLESMLRRIEALWSCLPTSIYPLAELDGIWKKVLINQFHDIIPGSSITRVYHDTHREYTESLEKCSEMAKKAACKLFKPSKSSMVLFNALTCSQHTAVELPASWKGVEVLDENGNKVPVQAESMGTVALVNVAPHSFCTLSKGTKQVAPKVGKTVSGKKPWILENSLVRYEFADDGTLVKAYDLELKREFVPAGKKGNLLSLYEDRPNKWDAWDVDVFYETLLLENARVISMQHLSDGPVRKGIAIRSAIGNSTIEQQVFLTAGSRRLDFRTRVEWNEKHRMLRVAFPVDVRSEQASFDIQYGFVRRNTHRNTTWDLGKFESAAHRYIDLSEPSFGAALLNDGKYGHKVLGNTLDLNLLRSPTSPDPDADEGTHEFTYSFLPHKGSLPESDVMEEAACLNHPPLMFDGFTVGSGRVPCGLESQGISLEVIKKAEKEDCLVLRLVEIKGDHSSGTLTVQAPYTKLVETDLIEWNDGKSVSVKKPVIVQLKPFEIRTYKLKR